MINFNQIKVLLINLDERPERLKSSINQLSNIFEFIIRVKACNSKEAYKKKEEYLSYRAFQNIEDISNDEIIPNYNSLGSIISHIKSWQYIIDNKIEHSFIIEDDIIIKDQTKFKLDCNEIIKFINNNINNNFSKLIAINSIQNNKNNYIVENDVIDEYFSSKYSSWYDCTEYSNNEFCNNIKLIKQKLDKFNFYYIDNKMANYLLNELYIKNNVTFQLMFEIDNLIQRTLYKEFIHNVKFYNLNTFSINRINEDFFPSDIQISRLSNNQLYNILKSKDINLPKDIINLIYNKLPKFYKYNSNNKIRHDVKK